MNPLDWFPGYKTYILAGGVILTSVGMWFSGDMALGEMVERVVAGSALVTLRKGVESSK